jgi:glycosyltransferase involved in cell wall biosynthesis
VAARELVAALRDRDIVCVGFADWRSTLWTNQQHLMSRLAAENRVLFIESLGLRRPTLAGRDVRRIAARLGRGLRGPRAAEAGVKVLSPLVLPFHGSRLVGDFNRRLLPLLVRRAMHRLGMRGDVLWAYVPQAEVLLDELEPRVVVYHCVDDIAAQEGVDARAFRAAEDRFARRADLVLASAPPLARRMRELAPNVLYAPNVADHDLFARALQEGPVDSALEALSAPRVVFTGAIVATKIDVRLIAELARLRPDWSFALVGPVGEGDPRTDVSALHGVPNLHLLGARAYAELPGVLHGAAAAMIPYAVNELTSSIFPMKVYEYLSAGLPVVATPLPSLEGVEGVTIASGAEEFAERLSELIEGDDGERRAARSALAARHSWDTRLEEIAAALERLPEKAA